jgi:hypothetical protein
VQIVAAIVGNILRSWELKANDYAAYKHGLSKRLADGSKRRVFCPIPTRRLRNRIPHRNGTNDLRLGEQSGRWESVVGMYI